MPWNKLDDLTGRRFGMWTVLGRGTTRPNGQTCWLVRCDCGVDKEVVGVVLRDGRSQSCGCRKSAALAAAAATHGHARVGKTTAEYRIWRAMKRRCLNSNDAAYAHYGGRGITVCERWATSYQAFLSDMGRRPSPAHSIDRKDNDRGYEPDNCRWATRAEQSRNRRSTKFVTFDGKNLCIEDWATRLGVDPELIANRLREGWDVATALTEPALKPETRPRDGAGKFVAHG